MNSMKNKKGITLIELIIAIGLVTIVLVAIYTVLSTGMRTFNINVASSEDQGNLRAAMMKMGKLKNQASKIDWISASSVTFTINGSNHKVSIVQETQPDGRKIPVLKDNSTTLATNVSGIELKPASKALLGADRMLTVTLSNGNSSFDTQFYVED